MNKPVFLCGFMGCGKSTVGRELSKLLGCDFIDLDSYIEEDSKMTISDIFKEFGEEHFRMLESSALEAMCDKQAVIATGGGALISEKNADAALRSGKVVYIELAFEKCYDRIKDSPNRPIVKRSTKEELEELFNRRTQSYKSHCSFTVNGDNTPREIAKEIISYF